MLYWEVTEFTSLVSTKGSYSLVLRDFWFCHVHVTKLHVDSPHGRQLLPKFAFFFRGRPLLTWRPPPKFAFGQIEAVSRATYVTDTRSAFRRGCKSQRALAAQTLCHKEYWHVAGAEHSLAAHLLDGHEPSAPHWQVVPDVPELGAQRCVLYPRRQAVGVRAS